MQIREINGYVANCEAKGVHRDVNLFMMQDEPLAVDDSSLFTSVMRSRRSRHRKRKQRGNFTSRCLIRKDTQAGDRIFPGHTGLNW